MKKKYVVLFSVLFLSTVAFQKCLTDPQKKIKNNIINTGNELNESFRKIGWIKDNKYRAVIFIITDDECKNSSLIEIEDRIKFEAYKHLQKELNPAFNRNASNQIKILADNFGKVIQTNQMCTDGKIYFYDLEKNDLKADFEKLKNLKQ